MHPSGQRSHPICSPPPPITLPSTSARLHLPSPPSCAPPGLRSTCAATDIVLCWDTYTAAANQAGYSRLSGGIHVAKDNVDGLALGRLVANDVWNKVAALAPGGLP